MSAAMAHRGPDGEGFHHESRLGLLHRLLRIFDTKTEPGPYVSGDGRWVLSYNGEIYNHQELHAALKANLPPDFGRFHTDAELLLEGWALEGPAFLGRVNGMFAFALWDRKEKRLTLGRDRLGEKPLYYYQDKKKFLFASEVKALKAAGVPMRLNRSALQDYLAYRYVSGPETLFAGIFKLPPGHLLNLGEDFSISISSYWAPSRQPAARESLDAARELSALLESSHRLRTSSICPPAVFLSGGVDSATIASFLPERSHAYTFLSPMTLPESEDARRISGRFGLKHQDVSEEGSLGEIVDQAIWALEEPLGDSIIIPTWSLARAASKATRVVLSGEGADEVFGGYVHHFLYQKLNRLQRLLPSTGWSAGAWLLKNIPPAILNRATPYPADLGAEARSRMLKTIQGLSAGKVGVSELTTLFPSHASGSRRLALESKIEDLHGLIRVDQQTWLPDYTLHRLDKILMNFGVEGRLPFLDHRIVELAAECHPGDLIRRNHRKWLLRKSVEGRLGQEIAWRKKKPFLLNLAKGPNDELRRRGIEAARSLEAKGLIGPGLEAESLEQPGFLAAKRLFALDALETWMRVYEIEV
jgi:asparagine synthase (glutamine-hydrolysing)